jgi:hypothetical protein
LPRTNTRWPLPWHSPHSIPRMMPVPWQCSQGIGTLSCVCSAEVRMLVQLRCGRYDPTTDRCQNERHPGCQNGGASVTQAVEKIGAGEGNRTLVISLEGCCSTIELHPRRAVSASAFAEGYGGTTFAVETVFQPYCRWREGWWERQDSNLRRRKPADLQSTSLLCFRL